MSFREPAKLFTVSIFHFQTPFLKVNYPLLIKNIMHLKKEGNLEKKEGGQKSRYCIVAREKESNSEFQDFCKI